MAANQPLLDALDGAGGLLADIERARSAAVRHLLDGNRALANAQVCLMCDYIDTLVLRGIEAVEASGPQRGLPSCLS